MPPATVTRDVRLEGYKALLVQLEQQAIQREAKRGLASDGATDDDAMSETTHEPSDATSDAASELGASEVASVAGTSDSSLASPYVGCSAPPALEPACGDIHVTPGITESGQRNRRDVTASEYRRVTATKDRRHSLNLVEPSLSLEIWATATNSHHLTCGCAATRFTSCATLSWCGRAQKHNMSWATVTFGE